MASTDGHVFFKAQNRVPNFNALVFKEIAAKCHELQYGNCWNLLEINGNLMRNCCYNTDEMPYMFV